jgi:tetratricopeptide (TPR) repeat protein
VRRIGRYELGPLIADGPHGALYEARDTELDRAVALKVLHPAADQIGELAARLARESRLMAKVEHPSVIAVYNVGRQDSVVFVAMERLGGPTLTAWLASHELDWRATLALFECAGQGLAAAHAAGVVHRAFQPDHVVVAGGGARVVVTEFGVAREAIDTTSDLAYRSAPASTAETSGSPYVAPEQLVGGQITRRADIFAFSVALWQALFGVLPFAGDSPAQRIVAMRRSPRPPPGARRVPRRLVRILHKGLADRPSDRWHDMPAMLAELAALRAIHKRIAVAAGAAGLVGLGIAAALVVSRRAPAIDRCASPLARFDETYNPAREAAMAAALARDPAIRDEVVPRLRADAEAWRQTQRATCRADRRVLQDPSTTACLDARRIELAGTVDDVIEGGPGGAAYAVALSELPGSPAACANPAPGLLFSRVPADRELRRQVTALRRRLPHPDDLHDPAEYRRALDEAAQIAAQADLPWPPLYAEAQCIRGTIQLRSGDGKAAIATLRDAAVTAERAHDDRTATTSWRLLAHAATSEGDPTRGLEYVLYAEAALDRIGRPKGDAAVIDYEKGLALIRANRGKEAERALQQAIELSADDRRLLPDALWGLAQFYGDQGRHADAVAALRKSVALLRRSPTGQIIDAPNSVEQLAQNLAAMGRPDEAVIEARRAVEIADRTLPQGQLERALVHLNLAEILPDAHGDTEAEAVAEAAGALAAIARDHGPHTARYADALASQAQVLAILGHPAHADRLFARACETLAFTVGDQEGIELVCEVAHAEALVALHRDAEARAKLDRVIPLLTREYGDAHPEVARALVTRGAAHAALGAHAAAIADFGHAIASLATAQCEPGPLASAKWRLGRELWDTDLARARAEITAGLKLFETANRRWSRERERAAAWWARRDPVVR